MGPLRICLLVSALLLVSVACGETGTDGMAMLFPVASDNSYALIQPVEPLDMQQFTLCLRVATEISGEREMILFSYFKHGDELNLWREKDGALSLYIRSNEHGVKFHLPDLNILETHLCVTWRSSSGVTTFWYNGRRSLSKVYSKDLRILPGGSVILGQDQDKANSEFDVKQCFVGSISDVHLWNYVLSASNIKELYEGTSNLYGNIINWSALRFTAHGHVIIRK